MAKSIVNEKSVVRQHLLSTRLGLSDSDRLIWDQQIFHSLVSLPFFQQANRLACFFSHLNEPNLLIALLNYLETHPEAQKKSLYLPILKKSASGSYLSFGLCTSETNYKSNLYGIPEPAVPPKDELNAHELDLMLVPLVGFNSAKKRIGMGGGFYDRTLSFKLTHPNTKPYLVGIAYACQKSENIPVEPHDIALDKIITQSQVY